MSIKDSFLLVSITVNKPQLTQKDDKATRDAEAANNASNAGQFRKDLYPKVLIAPILTVESSARAYVERTTYMWNRGEYLLPAARIDTFMDRMARYELEFSQAVTAFLNNWSNVMQQAQQSQGALFDPNAYPDTSDLKAQFRFRVNYANVRDADDLRVKASDDVVSLLKQQVERDTQEAMAAVIKAPLQRLRDTLAHLHEVTGKGDRTVVNKKTGVEEIKPPIFRDSVIGNLIDELALLNDFADLMPDDIKKLHETTANILVPAQTLRDDPDKRQEMHAHSGALLDAIADMLED